MDPVYALWAVIAALVVVSFVVYAYAVKFFRESGGDYDYTGAFGIGAIILGLLIDAIAVILYLAFIHQG